MQYPICEHRLVKQIDLETFYQLEWKFNKVSNLRCDFPEIIDEVRPCNHLKP